MLRKEAFPLRKVVNAVSHLADVFGAPGPNWEDARIFTDRNDIWVDHKNQWEITSATRSGQKVAHQLFGPEFSSLRERADSFLVPREFYQYVEIDPRVKNGHPVIRNTTIETVTIHALRTHKLTYNQIREYYPNLSRDQIVRSDKFEQFLDAEFLAA